MDRESFLRKKLFYNLVAIIVYAFLPLMNKKLYDTLVKKCDCGDDSFFHTSDTYHFVGWQLSWKYLITHIAVTNADSNYPSPNRSHLSFGKRKCSLRVDESQWEQFKSSERNLITPMFSCQTSPWKETTDIICYKANKL